MVQGGHLVATGMAVMTGSPNEAETASSVVVHLVRTMNTHAFHLLDIGTTPFSHPHPLSSPIFRYSCG